MGPAGLVGAGRGAGTLVHPDHHVSSECPMFTDMEKKNWFMENK